MEFNEAVASVLREERLKKGLSQEELAHLCGIDRTYVSLLERQKRKPTLSTIYKICESLGISMTYFINRTETLLNNQPNL